MNAKINAASSPLFVSKWNRRLPLVLTLLLCMLATGCSTLGTRRTAVEALPSLPPELLALLSQLKTADPELLTPCPAQLPEATRDDVDTLTRNHVESAGIYHDCSDKQSGLSKYTQQRDAEERARIERARKALEKSSK